MKCKKDNIDHVNHMYYCSECFKEMKQIILGFETFKEEMRKSEKRATAARLNGKKGGRPKKEK